MQRQRNRPTCKHCGRHRDEVGPMSNSGACPECGIRRLTENVVSMKLRSGPNFLRWRERMAASVGATLDTGGTNE